MMVGVDDIQAAHGILFVGDVRRAALDLIGDMVPRLTVGRV